MKLSEYIDYLLEIKEVMRDKDVEVIEELEEQYFEAKTPYLCILQHEKLKDKFRTGQTAVRIN